MVCHYFFISLFILSYFNQIHARQCYKLFDNPQRSSMFTVLSKIMIVWFDVPLAQLLSLDRNLLLKSLFLYSCIKCIPCVRVRSIILIEDYVCTLGNTKQTLWLVFRIACRLVLDFVLYCLKFLPFRCAFYLQSWQYQITKTQNICFMINIKFKWH